MSGFLDPRVGLIGPTANQSPFYESTFINSVNSLFSIGGIPGVPGSGTPSYNPMGVVPGNPYDLTSPITAALNLNKSISDWANQPDMGLLPGQFGLQGALTPGGLGFQGAGNPAGPGPTGPLNNIGNPLGFGPAATGGVPRLQPGKQNLDELRLIALVLQAFGGLGNLGGNGGGLNLFG